MTVYGPWEQEEGSDYDEPGSGGDSHEDEFDDEYGEQRPHGDPDRPDNALEDAFQADIEYWEEIARLNAIAKPFEPGGVFESDAAALNPHARPFDPDEPFTSDAATVSPFSEKLVDSSPVSASSQLTSPEPDDFDYVESVDQIGPPTPTRSEAADIQSFDPAAEFTPNDSYQAESFDAPILDSPAAALDMDSSQSFDPAVQFEPADTYQTERDSTEFLG